MSWNYRTVQHRDGSYGLHEVHYDGNGRPSMMTENVVGFRAYAEEGPEGIIEALEMALRGARESPVLIEAEAFPEQRT